MGKFGLQPPARRSEICLGDRRAAYLLLDDSRPAIRRVEYDVDKEIKALQSSGLPHAEWVAKVLDSGSFQMP
jgi:hypothetical protein